MKVIVATSATQGARPSDSTECVEGELVWLRDVCPASRRNPYGRCECARSFSGMSSNGYTTTALVRDFPGLTPAEYASALTASFDMQGWCACCTSRTVAEVIKELMELAAVIPDGTVIERCVDELAPRGSLSSAG